LFPQTSIQLSLRGNFTGGFGKVYKGHTMIQFLTVVYLSHHGLEVKLSSPCDAGGGGVPVSSKPGLENAPQSKEVFQSFIPKMTHVL